VTQPALVLQFDMIQTLALAAVVLFVGYGVRRSVGVLDRYNIPAPVVGGFLFATLSLVLRMTGIVALEFTTTLQTPLMIAFFTTIGLGASLALLKVGGPQVLLFFGLATVLVILQNVVGVSIAAALGVQPLLGLLAGSITMTGGHGTGAAFGQLLEVDHGFTGAVTLAMAAATFGLVSGGLIGGPIGTSLIKRLRGARPGPARDAAPTGAGTAGADALDAEIDTEPAGPPATAYTLLKVMTIILVAMWAGGLLGTWIQQNVSLPQFTFFGYTLGGGALTLPAYIGAMIVAAIIRNLSDVTRVLAIEQRTVDDLGTIALSLFLSMALMSLRLWELLDLALPMLVILAAQITLMATFAYFVTFHVMGRDYDAAVMAGGHCGFGMGATPNAVANMESLVERYGPAPRAFLVVPMVGAFFIDFTNSLIITIFISFAG
jgi:glutamate:Na+ symporter, ESS family